MAEKQPGTIIDPYRGYNFSVNLGTSRGDCYFAQCSGLGVKVEAISYREGGAGHVTRQVPGRVEYSHVTLKYGVTDGQAKELWNWLMTAAEGRVERENISIVMLNSDNSPGFQWDLLRAWPTEWNAAPLDALCQQVAIESLTLAFEELKRVSG